MVDRPIQVGLAQDSRPAISAGFCVLAEYHAPYRMRTETDSMGPMEVPDDALYGASTQRAVLNFPISSHRMPTGFVRALGLVLVPFGRVQ